MSFLLAIGHSLPNWLIGGGLGVAVAISIASALGFWPVIAGFIKVVVGMVPWGKWETWALFALAGSIFAARVALDMHDQKLLEVAHQEKVAAVAAERKACQAREDESNARYRAGLAALEAQLAAAKVAAEKAAKDLAVAQAKARAERERSGKELEAERSRNVTPEANRLCVLTRGGIVQFNAGARRANGQSHFVATEPAAGAGAGLVDDPAGVSFDTYERAVEGTQDALGTCRAQVTGWQDYHAKVIKPWIASTLKALEACVPR